MSSRAPEIVRAVVSALVDRELSDRKARDAVVTDAALAVVEPVRARVLEELTETTSRLQSLLAKMGGDAETSVHLDVLGLPALSVPTARSAMRPMAMPAFCAVRCARAHWRAAAHCRKRWKFTASSCSRAKACTPR